MPRAVSQLPGVAVRAGVAVADLRGLDGAVGGEVAAGDQVEHVAAGHVGAGHPAGALDDPRVDEVADPRRGGLPQRGRSDVALHEPGVLRELGLVHRLDLGGLHHSLEPLLVDLTVTGQPDRQRLAGAVCVLEHDQHVLEGVAGVPGPVVAGVLLVQVGDQGVDRRGVRRRLGVGGRCVVVGHGVRGPHLHRLDVGGVVTVRAADVGVLADVTAREELLRLRPTHRATGRLDDHVVEPEPVERPDVGLTVSCVRRVEALVAGVEGVGVLHRELAAADQPRAGTRLVAVLRLDLVEPDGQVLVRRVEVLHHEGEHLLVRRAEQVVGTLAVLEPEDAVAVVGPAVGRLVGLAGQQRGELQLLGADGVHLLAHDLLDLAEDAQAERQPRVDAGGGATDVAGAHEQPVAGHLRVDGILAKRPHEQRRHPQVSPGKASRGPVRRSDGVSLGPGAGAGKALRPCEPP